MEWLGILAPLIALAGVIFTVVGSMRMKRRDHLIAQQAASQTDLASRFDDASQLAQYIREEVERQVQPIRVELQAVKLESHEMHDAVRTRETQLWLWDQRGRQGDLPMLPLPVLKRLGLGHFADPDFDDTENPYRK